MTAHVPVVPGTTSDTTVPRLTDERTALLRELRTVEAERVQLQEQARQVAKQIASLNQREKDIRETLYAIDRVQRMKGHNNSGTR